MSPQSNDGGRSHGFIERLNTGFARVGGWSFDHRWWVVAMALLGLGASLALAANRRVDSSFEAYFDSADPTYRYYEQYRDEFGSDEISYILYSAPDFEYGPWNLEVMQRIIELTEALENEVPFVSEVTSLANAELMVGVEDGIEIHELRDDLPSTQVELLRLRDRYLAKPMLVGGILSADARHAAIIIEMDRTSTDPLEDIRWDPQGGDGLANLYPQVTDTAIAEILARPEYAGIEFWHSGDVPMNAAYNVIITEEGVILDAVTAGVVALLLALFFRSVAGTIAPVAVVQLSVITTVAFVVAIGWQLDMTFSGIPTLLTAIGVAHSVHILSEFRSRFAATGDRRTALTTTFYLVGTPCLMSSVTTAMGFASMSFSPIESIAHQGVYAAFGVMAAFFLSFTLLMALLSFGRRTRTGAARRGGERSLEKEAKGGATLRAALEGLSRFVLRRRAATLIGFGLVFLVSLAGIARIQVDSNWLNDFSDAMPLKHATVFVDEVMGGVTNLILLLDAGEPEAVKNPAVLHELERLQSWSSQHEIVRKSYSIADIVKDLNQSFHAGDPSYHTVPDSRDLIAQYLLLYETAGGSEASEYVSTDYQVAVLELRLALSSIRETAVLVSALESELAAQPLQATSVQITGIGALWLKLMDYIVTSQIEGFLIAFSAIGAVLCVLFRSFKTGLVAMLPNLSPVLLTLGIIGWMGLDLDYNKVSIAAVAMGIAVDDTIHLISRVRHEFRRLGSYEEAVRAALLDVGRALLITSVALVAGFLVLTLSLMDSQAVRGLLLAGTIVFALIADFLLLPALILTFQPFGPEGAQIDSPGAELRDAA